MTKSAPQSAPDTPRTSATFRAAVSGMDCGSCAQTIESSLRGLQGVHTSSINFARGSAEVSYDPDQISPDALATRIKALGYGVTPEAARAGPANLVFDVQGMDCSECAQTVQAGVSSLAGVQQASVNFGTGTLRVTPAGTPGAVAVTTQAILAAVEQAGYHATERAGSLPTRDLPVAPWWRQRRVAEVVIASALWLAGFLAEHAGQPAAVYAVPFLASMFLAGYPVARAGLYALRARRADMNVLMTVAAIGAIAIGRWDEGASVLILFAIGLTLQNLTLERTRRAIQALVKLVPAEALVRRPEGDVRVAVAEVAVGDTVLVRPGDRIPVDGVSTLR